MNFYRNACRVLKVYLRANIDVTLWQIWESQVLKEVKLLDLQLKFSTISIEDESLETMNERRAIYAGDRNLINSGGNEDRTKFGLSILRINELTLW